MPIVCKWFHFNHVFNHYASALFSFACCRVFLPHPLFCLSQTALKRACDDNEKVKLCFVQICNCTRDWILIQESVKSTSLLVGAREKTAIVCVGGKQCNWKRFTFIVILLMLPMLIRKGERETSFSFVTAEMLFDVNWIENIKKIFFHSFDFSMFLHRSGIFMAFNAFRFTLAVHSNSWLRDLLTKPLVKLSSKLSDFFPRAKLYRIASRICSTRLHKTFSLSVKGKKCSKTNLEHKFFNFDYPYFTFHSLTLFLLPFYGDMKNVLSKKDA